MLRVTYGEETNLTATEMAERQPWKFKQFLPGAPDPNEYEIKRIKSVQDSSALCRELSVRGESSWLQMLRTLQPLVSLRYGFS